MDVCELMIVVKVGVEIFLEDIERIVGLVKTAVRANDKVEMLLTDGLLDIGDVLIRSGGINFRPGASGVEMEDIDLLLPG